MAFKCSVCGSRRADKYAYCADCGGASCSYCGKPHQLVRPGRTQPMCDCKAGTLVSLRDQLEPARRSSPQALKNRLKAMARRNRESEAEVYFIGEEEP